MIFVIYFRFRVSFTVAVDSDGSPVSVSLSGDARRNIIVWMDHRAVSQAEQINACKSTVLQYCGGSLSPEMQAPKVLKIFLDELEFLATNFSSNKRAKFVLKICIAINYQEVIVKRDARWLECGK